MIATLTELRRETTRLLEAVKAGDEVILADYGRPVARLVAEPEAFTGEQAAALLAAWPGDAETADEIEAILNHARQARAARRQP